MAPVPVPQPQFLSEEISFPWDVAAASRAPQQAVGGCWGVHRAGRSVSGLFMGCRAEDMLSCQLPSSGLGLCHLSSLLWALLGPAAFALPARHGSRVVGVPEGSGMQRAGAQGTGTVKEHMGKERDVPCTSVNPCLD